MLQEFIDYLEEQVQNHSIYVWGAQGQDHAVISEQWIRNRETSTTNANRAIAYWKKQVNAGHGNVLRAFDCSGLAMYFLQNLKKIYPSDMTANGLKGKCEKLSKSELKKGDWVFRVDDGSAYHIGYIVDDNLNVIEAKGRDDGVVKRSLNASGTTYWNYFGRPPIFKDEIEGKDEPSEQEEEKIYTRTATEKIGEIYNSNGTREGGRYISKGDICKITDTITSNLLIPVEYPISGGTRKAYIKSLDGFNQNEIKNQEEEEMKIYTKTAKGKLSDIYDSNGKLESGRYIAKGDVCKITNVMTDKLLIPVEYPVSGGTRKAYIKSLELF